MVFKSSLSLSLSLHCVCVSGWPVGAVLGSAAYYSFGPNELWVGLCANPHQLRKWVLWVKQFAWEGKVRGHVLDMIFLLFPVSRWEFQCQLCVSCPKLLPEIWQSQYQNLGLEGYRAFFLVTNHTASSLLSLWFLICKMVSMTKLSMITFLATVLWGQDLISKWFQGSGRYFKWGQWE